MLHPAKNREPSDASDDFDVLDETEGSNGALALPSKIARYEKAHRRALAMSDYLASVGRNQESALLANCGVYLLFRWYYVPDVVRLHAATFCRKHLICPLCAIRRAAKVVRAYKERIEYVLGLEPDLRPYLWTPTVKNGEDGLERFNHLERSYRVVLQRRREFLARGRPWSAFANCAGGAGAFEMKRGSGSGLPHPHSHSITFWRGEPDREAIWTEWEDITGDSTNSNMTPIVSTEDLIGALCEVFKYAMKFGDLSLEDNVQWADDLRGRRLVRSFGNLYGVTVPEDLLDDDDELLADEPFIEIVYRYIAEVGYSVDWLSSVD